MKTTDQSFDSQSLLQLSALVGNQAALMNAAKLAAALSKNPTAMVATATALLTDAPESIKSLRAMGLDANALGQAACTAYRSKQCGLEDISSLVQVLMSSRIAPVEQQIIVKHLELLQNEISQERNSLLADFTEAYPPVEDMIKGPAAEVWLASPITDFLDQDIWNAMQDRPDLTASAIANPRGFLHGSAVREVNPAQLTDLDKIDPSLLTEYLRRVSQIDSSEQAIYLASSFLLSNELQGPAGARHRAALIPFFQYEMSKSTDFQGLAFTAMAQAAYDSDDRAFAHAIARMSDDAKFDIVTDQPLFIFHPSGCGGLYFPDFQLAPSNSSIPGAAPAKALSMPLFSWADYTMAFCGRPGPEGTSESSAKSNTHPHLNITFSPALDYIAESMKTLGLDTPILNRGSATVFRELAEIAHRFPEATAKNSPAVAAMFEAVVLILSVPVPLSLASPSESKRRL